MLKDFLEKNLEVLKARHSCTFGFIKRFTGFYNETGYIVSESKSGDVTLSVKEASGRLISYHSKYNPVRESQQVVSASYKGESHVLMLGLGLGYTAQLLLGQMPDIAYGKQLFIVEPDPFVLISALKYRDLTELLSDERIEFYLDSDADSVGEVWSNSVDWSVLDGMAIIEHSPSKIRFGEFFNRLLEKMKYLANRSRGNLITLMNVGSEFHTNNFLNLPEAFGLPGSERLFDKFTNVPAVVVAAGPSLDKNLKYLKKVKGRFPIIAVDTAYRHMLAKGIKPDIVCAADSSYENSLDFVGTEDEKEVILMAELMTHPDIFKIFKGAKMITTFGGGLYPQICKMREPVGKLICWGSVATMAFDLARNMGADPVIFIGLDLSFCDGRLHTRGSYSEDILYEGLHPFTSMENATAEYICNRGRFHYVGDDGGIVYTDTNMKAYKDWFEDQFRHSKAKVINATEGGIVNNFVEKMTLLEAIERYADKGMDVKKTLSDALSFPVVADYEALIADYQSKRELIKCYYDCIRSKWPVYQKLVKSLQDMTLEEVRAVDDGNFAGIMELHDSICGNTEIVQWFTALHAKFVTKHTSMVVSLRNDAKATAEQWLELIARFFSEYEKFSDYQIPLIDKALFELRRKCDKIKKDNV